MIGEVEVKYFSGSVKKFNEDIVGVSDYAWWVLDGAHFGDRITENDASWFVTSLSKNLQELSDRFKLPLKVVIERALFKTTIDFEILKKESSINEKQYYNPSAVIGMIRFNPISRQVEIFKLGDISIYYKYSSPKHIEENELVSDSRIEKYEEYLIGKLHEYMDKYKDFNKARQELTNDLIEVRNKYMNKPGGYFVLEPGREDVISEGEYIEIPVNDMKSFEALILSDGMYRIVEPFKRFNSMKDLVKFVRTAGFNQVYELIKFFSYSDKDLKRYRRAKIIDDASGIYLKIVR